MQKSSKFNGRSAAQYIARIAALAALLTVGKLALSFIPNVEVVTLLITVYGSALGICYALPSALIFCFVEMAIYGLGSWVPLYFVYWSLLAALSSLLLKGKRLFVAVAIGAAGSVLFGVLSACADTVFVASSIAPSRLGAYFVAYYIRGLYFDIVHVASSAITIAILYLPLVAALKKAAPDVAVSHALRLGRKMNVNFEYFRDPEL